MRSTTLGCTKARDSCQACAISKTRCTREKPSCSRCKTRGLECQHFLTRRTGRRRKNSASHPTSCTSRNSTSAKPTSTSRSNTDGVSRRDRSRSGDAVELGGLSLSPQPVGPQNGTALPPGNASDATSLDLTNGAFLMQDGAVVAAVSDAFFASDCLNMFPPLPDYAININEMGFTSSNLNVDLGFSDANDHLQLSVDDPTDDPTAAPILFESGMYSLPSSLQTQTPSSENSSIMRANITDWS
ncbi:hypothetical protein BDW71DRAFT_206063 [Aspergillus fruticulosus]